jgi:hypothetical protein
MRRVVVILKKKSRYYSRRVSTVVDPKPLKPKLVFAPPLLVHFLVFGVPYHT